MAETPNPYTQDLRDEAAKYPYAYGALDAAVDHFLEGLTSKEQLTRTFHQLREALAVVKAEARDTAVTS